MRNLKSRLFPMALVAALALAAAAIAGDGPATGKTAPVLAPILLLDLQRKRKEKVARMRALANQDTLTEGERTEFEALRDEVQGLETTIGREEFVARQEGEISRVNPTQRPTPEGLAVARHVRVPNPGIENIAELIYLARTAPGDSRIVALMELGTGSSGGLAVPDDFLPTLLEVPASAAIVRPRATVLPQGASPDAEVDMPALEQGSTKNMYGGVAVDWLAEGVTTAETGAKIRAITLQPKEVGAHVVLTQKLMRNWTGCGAKIEALLRNALIAAEDVAFLSGIGVNRPLGVLNSGALKTVNRAIANKIDYEDLCKMEDEFLDSGNGVWVVAKRAVHQLRIMEDSAGTLIWTDPKGTTPAMLMGRPVQVSYRSPALGAKGDIQLADFSYYLIRDGAAVNVALSEHVFFRERKVVVQISKSVDGQPWLDAPIKQEDGNTYSPFVALDVP